MKKIMSVLLSVLIIAGMVPVFALPVQAASYSGVCGSDITNVTYAFGGGVLTISGTGDMKNFNYYSDVPWFYYSSDIDSIVISDGVTSISNYAFYYCSNLTSITIPEGVTSIGYSAFYGCNSLASIAIPDSVTGIGSLAFYDCRSLTSVTIPDGLTHISNNAFEFCFGLESVTIPNSVTSIGAGAFKNCSSITDVYYSGTESDWNSIEIGAENDSLINATIYNEDNFGICGDNATWSYNIETRVLTIDGTGDMYDYGDGVNLDNRAPWDEYRYQTESIIIGDGITSIGDYAFYNNLTHSVTIGNSVADIGISAFEDSFGFESIIIPESVETIGDNAFYSCSNLKLVMNDSDYITPVIGSTDYGYLAYYADTVRNKSVIDGVVGSSVKWHFDFSAKTLEFSGEGDIPNYSNGDAPWYSISSYVYTVIIGDGITSIGNNSFVEFWSLASVTLGNSVRSIGNSAFYDCRSLTEITIPEGVTSIGTDAFYGCEALKTVTTYSANIIPTVGSTDYGYLAYYADDVIINVATLSGTCGDNLTWSIDFANGVLTISGEGAMANYSAGNTPWYSIRDYIENVIIEDGVTSIGNYAFYNLGYLTSITIPEGVTSIGYSAFNGCEALKTVTTQSIDIIPTVGSTDFGYLAYYADDVILAPTFNGIASDNLTWSFTTEDGVLTISGTGAMANYSIAGAPWYSISDYIKTVIIPEGVTSIGDYAFYGCSNLTSITIPKGVTSIGDEAFRGCSNLTSITIPEGVTSIGNCAFYYCTNLTSITIPSGVTSIGYSAFYGCEALKTVTTHSADIIPTVGSTDYGYLAYYADDVIVDITYSGTCGDNLTWSFDTSTGVLEISGTGDMYDYTDIGERPWNDYHYHIESIIIGDGITSIGDSAFDNYFLTSITIPDSVTSIGYNAFHNCHYLTSITIPDSVTSIGVQAFYGCYSLTSITIPDSVASVGNHAFGYCVSLTSITIPDSVTSIGDLTFSSCGNLTSITIPDSVTSIGYNAFYGCTSLTSITIPDTVTEIATDAFDGCENITLNVDYNSYAHYYAQSSNLNYEFSNLTDSGNWNDDGSIKWSFYDSGCIVITGAGDMQAYAIGKSPIAKYVNITEMVRIDNGITSVANRAFRNFAALKHVEFGKDVKSIGYEAFYNCTALSSVPFNEGLVSIGSLAFCNTGLISFLLPNTVTTINNRAFKNCEKLIYAEIPDSVTYLGYEVFMNNTALTGFKWSANLHYINSMMFNGCSVLRNITIPSTVYQIKSNAFANCSGLEVVTFANSATLYKGGLASNIFSGCNTKMSILAADNTPATSLGYSKGFTVNRYNLDDFEYTVDAGVCTITGYTGNSSKVTVPTEVGGKPVTSIGYGAFRNLTHVTSVILPSSITDIGARAFQNSGITEIALPESLKVINHSAFADCTELLSVTFEGNAVTYIYYGAFANCAKLARVVGFENQATNISSHTFKDCVSLSSISVNRNVPMLSSTAFVGCEDTLTIRCAKGSKAYLYAASKGYKYELMTNEIIASGALNPEMWTPSANIVGGVLATGANTKEVAVTSVNSYNLGNEWKASIYVDSPQWMGNDTAQPTKLIVGDVEAIIYNSENKGAVAPYIALNAKGAQVATYALASNMSTYNYGYDGKLEITYINGVINVSYRDSVVMSYSAPVGTLDFSNVNVALAVSGNWSSTKNFKITEFYLEAVK